MRQRLDFLYDQPEINALLEGEQFSLAFFDVNMPGYGSQFSANDLAQMYPQTRFCVLGGDTTMRLDMVPVQPQTAAPASFRPTAPIRPQMVAAVNQGGRNLSDLMQAVEQVHLPEQDAPNLTGRQLDVLRLVREGKATKEIARQLGLAVPTVKTHLAALYRQLGVRNRVEAAMTQTAPPPSAVVRTFPTPRANAPTLGLACVPIASLALRAVR